jgi:hypothetical protein
MRSAALQLRTDLEWVARAVVQLVSARMHRVDFVAPHRSALFRALAVRVRYVFALRHLRSAVLPNNLGRVHVSPADVAGAHATPQIILALAQLVSGAERASSPLRLVRSASVHAPSALALVVSGIVLPVSAMALVRFARMRGLHCLVRAVSLVSHAVSALARVRCTLVHLNCANRQLVCADSQHVCADDQQVCANDQQVCGNNQHVCADSQLGCADGQLGCAVVHLVYDMSQLVWAGGTE